MHNNTRHELLKFLFSLPTRLTQVGWSSAPFSTHRLTAICTILLFTLSSPALPRAAAKLPTVSMSHEGADCLKRADWQCAINLLISEYEDRGDRSGIQYYIAHAFRQLGRNAFENTNLLEAQELFEQAVSYNDEDPTLYAELGRIYLEQSLYEEAVTTFSRAYALDSINPHYAETLAQIHYLSGSLEDAIDYLEIAIALQPDRRDLTLRLTQLKAKEQSENNGVTQISQVFRLNAGDDIAREQINSIWRMLEDAWYHVGLELDFYPKRQITVYLVNSETFQTENGVPAWSGGVYEGRISLPLQSDEPEQTAEIITHEYTHALLYDAMAYRCPWWLNEGLAQYLSLSSQKRLQVILGAIRGQKQTGDWSKTAPELAELNETIKGSKQAALAYGLALSATDYLIDRYTIVTLRAILHSMAGGKKFEQALYENTGMTFTEFQDSWWRQL
ncbi:tetratricopeptide repeat protein [Desulfosediminicola ganghwensis]|uniref:tetratricopeptide repeat protein n=1 Tax=Desulfosediminicola ganghwensis TaxID=2569540 RepID=UPI0010AC3786|nr:tetratricopeptide repeat protein [Desulfosediminicola ganghwensis]